MLWRVPTGRGGRRGLPLYCARGLPEYGCVIGDRWGVSDNETLRSYPCDDFVDSPTLQAWRGVRVEAPAEAVWPWWHR